MNYRDVQTLNGSLDALGDTLLKNRMLTEQSKERQAQTGLARQRLATDEAFRNAQQSHYNAMESKASDANTLAGQRAVAQEDQNYLHTLISANSGGMLDDDTLEQVNEALASHPRLGLTGIQLSKPKQISPQAGQNATAQAIQQAEYWHQQIPLAKSDEDTARFQENEDIMRAIAKKAAAEAPAPKPDRNVTVKTGGGGPMGGGGPEVTQKMTPAEYQIYQSQNAPPAPADPKQRVPGRQYKSNTGQLGTWTGTGWRVEPGASPQPIQ